MSLPRSDYTDPNVFSQEMSTHFTSRLFIGTDHDYASANNYLSLQIGAYAITCRKTDTDICAFNNVCLHRNCLIDPPGQGSRPFQCGYHGWRYDRHGHLSHAPLCELETITNKRLQRFPVVSSNQLHFTSLTTNPPDIGEVDTLISDLDLHYDAPPFQQGELLHHCNWKLLVENVLESYHVSFVHKDSFVPTGISSNTQGDERFGNYTSWVKANPDRPDIAKALAHLPGAHHHYYHGYAFPSLFVANTNNLIGYIAHLEPISNRQTLLKWQLFELPALRSLPLVVRQKVCADATIFVKQTLLEDKTLVELCQQGLTSIGPALQLQPQEARIQHFHRLCTL